MVPVGGSGPGEDQLQLARVASEVAEQTVLHHLQTRVVAPSARGAERPGRQGVPQDRGRVGQPQVHVAVGSQGGQHPVLGPVQPGQPEHRQPLGEVQVRVAGGQPVERLGQPLGGRRDRELGAQPSPELSLPGAVRAQGGAVGVHVLPGPPPVQQLGALGPVPGEQVGRPAGGQPAPTAARLLGRATAQVAPQQLGPGVVPSHVEDRQDRPDRARRVPRIGVGVHVGQRGQGGGHQSAHRGEVDSRAHPQSVGQLLRQPTLHTPGGHGDHLGRERVRQRGGQQIGQPGHQPVGPLGAVQVETHGALSLDTGSDSPAPPVLP